ncbi:unnamed protein product, partial [Rotaria sp. Silwood1]
MEETSNEKQLASQFYFACRNDDFDLAIHLLNQHQLEDIDRMEPNGSTALHAACYYKRIDIVKILLDRGFTRRVVNKFDKTPIDEANTEELRQLFLRPKTSNRFGGNISYEREKSIWIPVDGNENVIIQDPITDLYKGNRLNYGIFQADNIIKQLNGMPKLDVIQRFFRRAVQEKDLTRLIQAYTAETDFYNHVNNYLLSRQPENSLSQFVQIIYFNDQLHKKFSYEGTCYRNQLLPNVFILNNNQAKATSNHLLIMLIVSEDENNIQQPTTRISLRQLRIIRNSFDDDPPPYPGLEITAHIRPKTTYFLPKRSSNIHDQIISISNDEYSSENSQDAIQTRQWKASDNQYRICYTGNLSDDFLRIQLSLKSQVTNQKQFDRTSFTTVQSDQHIPSTFYHFSTKSSTSKIFKRSKIHARMLHNILTKIERGQTRKLPMVPEEPITQSDGYSYEKDDLFINQEGIPLPAAPFVTKYESLQLE